MKKFLVVFLVTLATMSISAQDPNESDVETIEDSTSDEVADVDAKSNEPAVNKDDSDPSETDEVKTPSNTPDTFDPTENISEDYAVPFPVDI